MGTGKSRLKTVINIVPVQAQRPGRYESQWCNFKYEFESEGKRPMSQFKDCQAERKNYFYNILFYSGLQLLDEAHSHWARQSDLFSLPVQVIVSSRHTSQTCQTFCLAKHLGSTCSNKMIHKINYHKTFCPILIRSYIFYY
jgi:hypothetical protein